MKDEAGIAKIKQLSGRARSVLGDWGANYIDERTGLLAGVQIAREVVTRQLLRRRHCGVKTFNEIACWIGLSERQIVAKQKLCRHCGKVP
jgi:hypothetical protein